MPKQQLVITYLGHGDIYPDPFNPREVFAEAELEELRGSIAEHGIISPIAVRLLPDNYSGARYRIIYGERRWRASEGTLENLPCIIYDVDDATAREMSLDENFQREDLTVEAEAKLVRDYLEMNFTIAKIASKRNKKVGWVNNRIAYLKVGRDVREVGARVSGALSALTLTDRVKDADLRKSLLHRIEAEEMPFKDVKEEVDSYFENRETKERAAANAAAQAKAPDAHTQERQNAHERGESSSVSRGHRVTGGVARPSPGKRKQKSRARNEANGEVRRAMMNLESWITLCDGDTHAAAKELCRRILTGDLARK